MAVTRLTIPFLLGLLLGLIILQGCVSVQVDEPLVDLGDSPKHVKPLRGEPSDEQAKIQWLRDQLVRCRRKLAEKEEKLDEREEKLDRCEDRIEQLEEVNEQLRERLKK